MAQDSGDQLGAIGDRFAWITKLLPIYAAFQAIRNAPDTRGKVVASLELAKLAATLTPTLTDDEIVAAIVLLASDEKLLQIVVAFIDRQLFSKGNFGAEAELPESERTDLADAGLSIGLVLAIATAVLKLIEFLNRDVE